MAEHLARWRLKAQAKERARVSASVKGVAARRGLLDKSAKSGAAAPAQETAPLLPPPVTRAAVVTESDSDGITSPSAPDSPSSCAREFVGSDLNGRSHLFDRYGQQIDKKIYRPLPTLTKPENMYATFNLACFQLSLNLSCTHALECAAQNDHKGELFLVPHSSKANFKCASGTLYQEVQMQCRGCGLCFRFATDGFTTNPNAGDKRRTVLSQLTKRTLIAMVGLQGTFKDVETMQEITGNICKFYSKTYSAGTQLLGEEVNKEMVERCNRNIEVAKQVYVDLAATEPNNPQVLKQNTIPFIRDPPTHTRSLYCLVTLYSK